MNNRHAIVNEQGLVVNMIVWEGAEFLPPRNHTVINLNDRYEANGRVGIGDTYKFDTDSFVLLDRTAKDPEPEV
jgi:hypothetical protein